MYSLDDTLRASFIDSTKVIGLIENIEQILFATEGVGDLTMIT